MRYLLILLVFLMLSCKNETKVEATFTSNTNDEVIELEIVDFSGLEKYLTTTNNIKSKVVVLNDMDSNSWIPKVDESWSGAIPATLIFNNQTRKFFEKPFTYKELEYEINQFLK